MSKRRTSRILPAEVTPTGALTWETPTERRQALRRWRRMVCQSFNSRRALRVAWALSDLFNSKSGFAHAGDKYLAAEIGLSMKQVGEALAALDRGKAIIRVHRIVDGRTRRHIYPAGLTPL
jgi:hypothetical protein